MTATTSTSVPASSRRPPLAGLLCGALAAGAAIGLLGAISASLLLAATAVVGLVAALLYRDDIAVTFVVVILYTDLAVVAVRDHGAPYVLAAAIPIVLLVPICRSLAAGGRIVLGRTLGWLLALVAFACVSALASDHPERAIAGVSDLVIQGVLLYVLVINAVRTERTLRMALWAVVGAVGLLAAITVGQRLTGLTEHPFWGLAPLDPDFYIGHVASPRAYGPVGDPNYYAQLLLPGVAIAVVLALGSAERMLKIGGLVVAGLVVWALGYTSSRGGAIALVVAVAAMVPLRYVRGRGLAAFFLCLAVLLVAVPGYRERLLTLQDVGGATAQAGTSSAADDSTRSRTTENLAALLVVHDRPLVGAGPTVFPLLYQEYAPRVGIEVQETTRRGSEAGSAPTREAHNLFLGLAADLGLPGLLIFCGLLLSAFGGMLRTRRRCAATQPAVARAAGALFVGLLAYVAAGMFLSLAFDRYFWLLMGLCGATIEIARHSAPPAQRP